MILPQSDQDSGNIPHYTGMDRRVERHVILTDEQLDAIAEAAAERAVAKITDHVYRQVGKSLISKLIWVVGALGTAVYLWLQSRGVVK